MKASEMVLHIGANLRDLDVTVLPDGLREEFVNRLWSLTLISIRIELETKGNDLPIVEIEKAIENMDQLLELLGGAVG